MAELIWRGCVLPDDLLYQVENHVWVRPKDGEVEMGMTDVAQTMGGRLVQVTWRDPGKKVRQGRPAAVIESAKWVGPFVSPVSGEIVANNKDAFAADSAIANRDPYGKGWLYRVRLAEEESLESSGLVEALEAFEFYKSFIEENKLTCMRCAD